MGLEVREDKIIANCDNCGKELKLSESKFNNTKHHFCNKKCFNEYQKRNQIECVCAVCGVHFFRKKSQVDNIKDSKNLTCSKKCCYELRKTLYKGDGNHQYGITGSKNKSWQSDERYKSEDNKYTLIRMENHPFRDKRNFVSEHRLIAEKHLLTDTNSVEINGNRYLKPECVVHHIDFNKKNNKVENLYVFESDGLHCLFHNLFKSKRVKDIDDFLNYYKSNYINKILNYEWLYKAYIAFDLSINQISKLFNIPYKSIQDEVYKNNLDNIKKQKTGKEETLKLIVKELNMISDSNK